ncbi:receptor-like protein 7 isoform X2 [Rosa chinensis]|uniref:receptor-like protein 7 isoform X2 n=1 Tax=Rosa chinensis TaxID=74649 RepID=UPI001AD8BBA5|nr:receptor-like protein 7 isoform X2 [Rosa chinensis]
MVSARKLRYRTEPSPSRCIEVEQQSLLHFKKSLVFDSSKSSKLITWNSSTDCCSWLGVTCSTNGSVVCIDISSESFSSFSRSIDNSSSLFQIQHLQSLNLAYNYFNGSSIPSAIEKLTELSNATEDHITSDTEVFITHLEIRSSFIPITLSFCPNCQSQFQPLIAGD